MKNYCLFILLLSLLFSCNSQKYQEIDELDLKEYDAGISELWKDSNGNRLLCAYTDHGAGGYGRDYIYEKNNKEKKYFLISRWNGFDSPLKVSYYKDSLLLLHESPSEGFAEWKEWWIEVKPETWHVSYQMNSSGDTIKTDSTFAIEFDSPDSLLINKFSKEYLNSLSNGVYKVSQRSLIKVCDYHKYKDWADLSEEGVGIYYFAKPGKFYKHHINLAELK